MLPAVEKDSRLAWGSFPIDAIPYSRDPNGRLDRDKHNLYCCRCSYYCRFVFWAFIFYFPSIRNHIELVFFLSFFLDRHHHHHLRGRAAVCWTRITHTSISQQQQLAVAVIYNPKWVDSYYILNCYWLADWLMVLRYLGNWQRTVSHATLMYNTFFFFSSSSFSHGFHLLLRFISLFLIKLTRYLNPFAGKPRNFYLISPRQQLSIQTLRYSFSLAYVDSLESPFIPTL